MAGHHHDHIHAGDPHAPVAEHGPSPEYLLLERAVRELLVAKGVFAADDMRRQIDLTDSRNPAMGAKLVARAWTDPAFRKKLLAEPKAAAGEMGIDVSNTPELIVLENTPTRHHLVVCTLCSCYPKAILGIPPAWYKSAAYRARAVKDPRGVLAEFGTALPPEIELRVVDSTADLRYLVLPRRPAGTDGLDEAALAALVTRDSMIGVSHPLSPA
ncbi:MAG: nitrile hydratase subunit alpha [Rhodospirillales bacterium]|nr:nitrile hydratase subunit alpha [Rhodospirillales bacterium]